MVSRAIALFFARRRCASSRAGRRHAGNLVIWNFGKRAGVVRFPGSQIPRTPENPGCHRRGATGVGGTHRRPPRPRTGPLAPEWPEARRSPSAHDRPHGATSRVTSGAREVTSRSVVAVQRGCGRDETGRMVRKHEVGPRRLSLCAGWPFGNFSWEPASAIAASLEMENQATRGMARSSKARGGSV